MDTSAQNTHPAVGTWTLDPASSSIGFRAKALFGMKVNGRFDRYETSINIGTDAVSSSVSISIRADSVNTGSKKRDEHLRSGNAFAVTTFPNIEFASTSITETAAGLDIAGQLHVRDVSKPVTLHATRVAGTGADRYTAETVVMPKEFGITRPGTGKPLTVVIDAVLRRA